MFPDKIRQFYGADILALPVVGTALGDQDSILIFQQIQGSCAVHGGLKVSLISCEQDRERSQRNILRHVGGNLFESLTVRDDQGRRFSERSQGLLKLGIPCYDRDGARFQNIPDSLLLRKDQPSFWGGLVDRDDKDCQVGRFQQIADDLKPGVRDRNQRRKLFFQLLYVHSGGGTDPHNRQRDTLCKALRYG